MDKDSDLIAIPYILGLVAAVVVVTAAFFLVGAALAIPLLILVMVILGVVAYRGLKNDDTE
jgi:hypothetical protein